MKNNFEHWVRFKTTLPDDTIDDGERIVVFGGQNVRDAICEIMIGIGCSISKKWHESEQGWHALGSYRSNDFWIQVQSIEEIIMCFESSRVWRLFPKYKYSATDYPEFMEKFSTAFRADPRFHDIRWGLDFEIEDSPWQDNPFLTKPDPS